MWRSLCLAIALTTAAPLLSAQQDAARLADVSGTWVINIESHQFGLELEQKGSTVEGVLHAMGNRTPLIGTYVDRKLELKGEKAADEIAHAASDAGPITATMLDNGTLEGELSTNHGRMKWIGERFKKP